MIRDVAVTVDAGSWPSAAAPPAIAALSFVNQINVAELLLHTALCTRPPSVRGFHLADCWAWMRYLPAISADQKLRLRPEWSEVDPHQKTILSDELAVGMTTYLLAQELGCLEFVDTTYALNLVYPGRFRFATRARQGPAKSPDFVGRLPDSRFVILECKGTQTSVNTLKRAIKKGQAQKTNLDPLANTCVAASVVGGLFIPQWQSKQEACVVFADPEWGEAQRLIDAANPVLMRRAVVRVGVAKSLALAGYADAASALSEALVETDQIRRLFDDRSPIMRTIRFRVDSQGQPRWLTDTVDRMREQAIEFKVDATPLVQMLRKRAHLEDSLDELAKRTLETRWERAGDQGSAGLTTPYGVSTSLRIGAR